MSKAEREAQEGEERSAPTSTVVHEAISSEGVEALSRPSGALFWSALAAGLSMGFSLVAEGLLTTLLPNNVWSPLVSKLGYSVGFLIVILGRQQLYTESTLTPMIPVLDRKAGATIRNLARLWSVVLVGNLLGALIFALVATKTNAFDAQVRAAFAEIGQGMLEPGFGLILLRAIFAGWLIALMVWLLPFAESARVWVIIILTYLVGIGHLSHIVAGAVATFGLAAIGGTSWLNVLGGFVLPTLIGNTIGGAVLVAAINHAQVASRSGVPRESAELQQG